MADDCKVPGEPPPPTLCDLDKSQPNRWVEGPDPATAICILDTLTEDQVIYILERSEQAREDLRKVTSDERLLYLADTVPRLPTERDADRTTHMQSIYVPLYSAFHGKPPWPGG